MTPLRRRALARLPMTEAEVEATYARYDPTVTATGRGFVDLRPIQALCESHERLRAELAGAAAMLAAAERKARHGCTDATCTECDRWP